MNQWNVPPVPVGPQYPGAGGQLQLRLSRDGKTTSLEPNDGEQIDDKVGPSSGACGWLVDRRHRVSAV